MLNPLFVVLLAWVFVPASFAAAPAKEEKDQDCLEDVMCVDCLQSCYNFFGNNPGRPLTNCHARCELGDLPKKGIFYDPTFQFLPEDD